MHSTIAPRWKFLGKFSETCKLAFISAFVIGVIVHIYVFTNLLPNHDSLFYLYTNNDVTESGRWSLKWLSSLSAYYQMPVVIGMVSLLALALCAVFTVSVLEISHPLSIVLASGLIVSYPSVACIFSYLFTADAYLIALCLNAAGVWLAKRYRWGWLPCVLLLALAMGTYQAFICYAGGLFLMDCILMLYSEKSVKDTLAQGVRYLLILAAATVVYYGAMHFFLQLRHVELTSYQGLNELGTIGLTEYLSAVPNVIRTFLKHLWSTPYLSPFFQKIQRVVCVLFIGCAGYLWGSRKLYRAPAKTVLLVFGFSMIPLALNLISVIMIHSNVTMLVLYAFVLFDVFFLKLAELSFGQETGSPIRGRFCKNCASFAAFGLSAILLWSNFCVCNEAYLRMQIRYENTFALSNRVAARIESLEDFSFDLPVVFAGIPGNFGNASNGLSKHGNEMTGTANGILYFNTHYAYAYFRDYLGMRSPQANMETIRRVESSGILQEMPSYPDKDSIRVWDGVILVKFSDGKISW